MLLKSLLLISSTIQPVTKQTPHDFGKDFYNIGQSATNKDETETLQLDSGGLSIPVT